MHPVMFAVAEGQSVTPLPPENVDVAVFTQQETRVLDLSQIATNDADTTPLQLQRLSRKPHPVVQCPKDPPDLLGNDAEPSSGRMLSMEIIRKDSFGEVDAEDPNAGSKRARGRKNKKKLTAAAPRLPLPTVAPAPVDFVHPDLDPTAVAAGLALATAPPESAEKARKSTKDWMNSAQGWADSLATQEPTRKRSVRRRKATGRSDTMSRAAKQAQPGQDAVSAWRDLYETPGVGLQLCTERTARPSHRRSVQFKNEVEEIEPSPSYIAFIEADDLEDEDSVDHADSRRRRFSGAFSFVRKLSRRVTAPAEAEKDVTVGPRRATSPSQVDVRSSFTEDEKMEDPKVIFPEKYREDTAGSSSVRNSSSANFVNADSVEVRGADSSKPKVMFKPFPRENNYTPDDNDSVRSAVTPRSDATSRSFSTRSRSSMPESVGRQSNFDNSSDFHSRQSTVGERDDAGERMRDVVEAFAETHPRDGRRRSTLDPFLFRSSPKLPNNPVPNPAEVIQRRSTLDPQVEHGDLKPPSRRDTQNHHRTLPISPPGRPIG